MKRELSTCLRSGRALRLPRERARGRGRPFLTAERVVRSLNQIIEWRGKPKAIRIDNGPEYVSGKLMKWAEKQGVRLEYTQPGKSQQNAYIERYNRTVRGEWLTNTSLKRLRRHRIRPRYGSGLTAMNDPTWASAA